MSANNSAARHRLRAYDYLLASGLFVGYLSLLIFTMDMGFTRDEGYYFHAAYVYQGWFDELRANREAGHGEDSFTQESIDRHWSVNPEHPILMKTLFGLSWRAFSQQRDWLSESSAMRLPTAVFSALLIALVFLFSVEAFGSRIGALFAALATGFQPRIFFHAHLSCFDAPITALWFLVVYAYWRSLDSRLWAWLTGVFFGLALITKLNAFFIPVALIIHWVVSGARQFGWEKRSGEKLPRLRIPPIPLAFVTMAVLGPLTSYLAWPRHWFDTFNRITWYIGRHWHHEHYYVTYFGDGLVRPPFPVSFPFVMTLITVPTIILVTGLLGGLVASKDWAQRWWRTGWALLSLPWRFSRNLFKSDHSTRPLWTASETTSNPNNPPDPRATTFLIALNLLWPIIIIAQPDTPIFGGTKHWMPGMPYLAMFSSVGVIWAFNLFARTAQLHQPHRRLAKNLTLALFALVLALPFLHATYSTHPFGTSYYNELIGGMRGAADHDLKPQFWGYSTREGLDYLNQQEPTNLRIFPHKANPDAMHWYRREGLLRPGIHNEWDPAHADYAFFNHQKAFLSELRWNTIDAVLIRIWRTHGTAPLRVWTTRQGLPILSLYGNSPARARYLADTALNQQLQ